MVDFSVQRSRLRIPASDVIMFYVYLWGSKKVRRAITGPLAEGNDNAEEFVHACDSVGVFPAKTR